MKHISEIVRPPYLGVAYYPEDWPRAQIDSDIAMMQKAGINVARIAEFAWHRMEPRDGEYDFGWLHEVVDKLSAAGIATGLSGYFGRECGVQRHIGIFQSMGIWQEDGRARPKPGDLICITWGATSQPNDGFANHIAVVEKVSKKGVITILEGNNKDSAVGRRKFKVGDPVIRGYAIPRYAS